MRTYQNDHNMLLNFPRCRKTDNNALGIDALYNLKLRKTEKNNLIQQTTLPSN
jgi:hypothetical protein